MMDRRTVMIGGGLSLLVTAGDAGAVGSRRRFAWPDGRAGAVSITYDDGLDSHLDIAMPALEQRGLRGTFYLTMSNIARRLADWEAAAQRGQELANHTMSHPCDLQRFSPRAFAAEQIAPMEAWLRRTTPAARVPTFAYTCDVTNLGAGGPNPQAHRYARLLAGQGIVAARTSEGEPNRPATALRRPHRLQALAVGFDAPDVKSVLAYLAAAQHGHWAILVFHDLVAQVSEQGQVAIDTHARILDGIASLDLWSAPLGETFGAIRSAMPKIAGGP